MTEFEEKYLKYKTKYLALRKKLVINKIIQNNEMTGGTTNFLDLINLSDTPEFNITKQTGETTNFLDLYNLSDTPNIINNTQDGGKKTGNKKHLLPSYSESSSTHNSTTSDKKTGNKKHLLPSYSESSSTHTSTTSDKKALLVIGDKGKTKPFKQNDSSSESDSSESSLLSALDDSLSDSDSDSN